MKDIHVIELVLKRYDCEEGWFETIGIIGRFTDEGLFNESLKRAKEKVLPRVNTWLKKNEPKFYADLLTWNATLNDYNYNFEIDPIMTFIYG